MTIPTQTLHIFHRPFALGIVLVGLALCTPAAAIKPLTTERLMGYCKTFEGTVTSAEDKACIHYIQGFVDGAVATDGWVARNVAKQLSVSQGYSDRLAEVRFGRQTRDYGPTYFAEFCIPDEETLTEVAVKVAFDLEIAGFVDDTPLARDAVFKALRKDYRCEP